MDELIDGAWLVSAGIYPSDCEPIEYGVRVVGGDDDGSKMDSNDDRPGDEIATLVVYPYNGGADCYLEVYDSTSLNTISLVSLGKRRTRAEILDLCRGLKAWAVRYEAAGPACDR